LNTLEGQTCVPGIPLYDVDHSGTKLFFVFQDLAIRQIGTFALQCTILDPIRYHPLTSQRVISSMRTTPFTVYPSKRVPKGEYSSLLQKKLDTQIRTLWGNPYSTNEILQLQHDEHFQSAIQGSKTHIAL
jgi:hypothetical protein